jgi:hypothetical protein
LKDDRKRTREIIRQQKLCTQWWDGGDMGCEVLDHTNFQPYMMLVNERRKQNNYINTRSTSHTRETTWDKAESTKCGWSMWNKKVEIVKDRWDWNWNNKRKKRFIYRV